MDALISKIKCLEGEVKILGDENDRFRKLAADAEIATANQRAAYLVLENNYETERRKRVNLELQLIDSQCKGNANATPDTADASKPGFTGTAVEETSKTEEPRSPACLPTPPSETQRLPSDAKLQIPQTPVTKVKIKQSPSSKRKFNEVVIIDQNKKMKIGHEDENMNVDIDQKMEDNTAPKMDRSNPSGSQALYSSASPDPSISSIPPEASAPSTCFPPRPRRPVRQTSRLPITMAQLQSAAAEGSPSTAVASPSPQKPLPKTPVKKSYHQKVPAGPLVPIPPIACLPKQQTSVPPSTRKLESLIEEKKVKVSVKAKGGFALSPTEVSKHLKDASCFPIRPAPVPIQVSRKALTEAYGLPGMGFLWTSKDKRHQFMIPKLTANPDMPRLPGEPGLLLSCREEMCRNGPWTLFIHAEGKKVRMNYAGEYTCKTVAKMTKEEFASQQPAVKVAWGKKIAKSKKFPIYRELRARITLRKKYRIEPTRTEIQAEALLINTKDYTSCLTDIDVVEAFERGEEQISIVKIECVSYSHERAGDYVKAQTACERREREKASADSLISPQDRQRKGNGKSKGKNKKSSLGAMALDDEIEVDELVESEDEGGVDTGMPDFPSISVGTSRPMRASRGLSTKSYKGMMQEEDSDLSDFTDLDSDGDSE